MKAALALHHIAQLIGSQRKCGIRKRRGQIIVGNAAECVVFGVAVLSDDLCPVPIGFESLKRLQCTEAGCFPASAGASRIFELRMADENMGYGDASWGVFPRVTRRRGVLEALLSLAGPAPGGLGGLGRRIWPRGGVSTASSQQQQPRVESAPHAGEYTVLDSGCCRIYAASHSGP